MGEQLPNEYGSRYALPFKSLELAVPGLSNLFHMAPCEKSEAVEAGAKGANLLLSGTFVGGNAVLAKCVVAFHPSRGCVMQIVVRSKSARCRSACAELSSSRAKPKLFRPA